MKHYLNRENVTALVIVVVGVLIASIVAAPLQRFVAGWFKKKPAA